ncbi:hypothetical protein [Salinisphaera sp. G21_0]|uniref:hypothetical protein n=1 Tax=Salinisphaera sp. G21_0 TaxID=2821094 RepID=UPI001ADBBDAD|nr:hypothetical protein [Salinisphaera sp. G21_0]MBO9481586.1 hypothetical protein [Salinisphaera sp. G21_0]
MSLSNKPALFESAFPDPCFSPSYLLGRIGKSGSGKCHLTYQGMPVQSLKTPFPIYHNQSDIPKNNNNSCNSLNKYGIKPITPDDTEDFIRTDDPDIPESVLNQYSPRSSSDKSEDETLSLIPNIPFLQGLCLSESEPWIREPTTASHWNPDDQITNLSVASSKPQSLNKKTSDNHTKQSEEIVNNDASIARCQTKHRGDPAYVKRERVLHKERCKYPAYLKRKRERQRELRKNPAYIERERERLRKRYKDPAFAERERERLRQHRRNQANLKRQCAQQTAGCEE